MASYTVIPRLEGLYPFCIERVEADGSIVTFERWPTEVLAVNRLEDIEEEAAVNERRESLPLYRFFQRSTEHHGADLIRSSQVDRHGGVRQQML